MVVFCVPIEPFAIEPGVMVEPEIVPPVPSKTT